jgi:hypothetical protein
MRRKNIFPTLLCLSVFAAGSLAAAQSLGDFARQQRDKQGKEAKKAAKVYTNENMPVAPPEEAATPVAGMAGTAPPGAEAQPGSAPAASEPGAAKTAGEAKPEEAAPPTSAEKPEDKIKTKDYWQDKFKAARLQLAKAQEEQQLVEDELQLLQIQQAREIAPEVQAEVAQKMAAKKDEIETKRGATAKTQKALDDLEKDFKDSGAPEDWSKTE